MRVRATYAFDLNQKCVLAGQWARITVEQRLEGEVISLVSRPQAAAAAKGQRRKPSREPNKKRIEKERMRRENCSSKRTANKSKQQPQPARAASSSRQQQPARAARSC